MSKIVLATAILGLGIAGAFFAVQHANVTAQSPVLDAQNNNLVTGTPFVEKINSGLTQSGADTAANLTDEFTKNLAQEITAANPSGPQQNGDKKDIAVPNPDKIATDLLVAAQKNFDLQKLIPAIKDSDIKITSDSAKDALLAYTEKFDAITSAWRAGINTFDPQKDFSQENLDQDIAQYNDAIAQLYALPVPKLLSQLHKTEISYLRTELTLLNEIKNADKDPMAALLAGQNFQNLDDEFNKKMNEQLQLFLKAANKA